MDEQKVKPASKFDVVVYALDINSFDFEAWNDSVMSTSAADAAVAYVPLAIGSRTRFENGKATMRAVVTDEDGRVEGFEVVIAAVVESVDGLDSNAVAALKAG